MGPALEFALFIGALVALLGLLAATHWWCYRLGIERVEEGALAIRTMERDEQKERADELEQASLAARESGGKLMDQLARERGAPPGLDGERMLLRGEAPAGPPSPGVAAGPDPRPDRST